VSEIYSFNDCKTSHLTDITCQGYHNVRQKLTKTNSLCKCFTLLYIWSKYKPTEFKLFVIDGRRVWISRNRYRYKGQDKPTISALCALNSCKEEPLGWNKLHLMIAVKINEPKDSSVRLQYPILGSYPAKSIQFTLLQASSLRSILTWHSKSHWRLHYGNFQQDCSAKISHTVPLFPPLCCWSLTYWFDLTILTT